MKNPEFPLIDISEKGFNGENCFPVLEKNSITISTMVFMKHWLRREFYDSLGDCYVITGFELLSKIRIPIPFLYRRMRIEFVKSSKTIELVELKEKGISKSDKIYFLEEDEVAGFQEKINQQSNFRSLIILLSEYRNEIFD